MFCSRTGRLVASSTNASNSDVDNKNATIDSSSHQRNNSIVLTPPERLLTLFGAEEVLSFGALFSVPDPFLQLPKNPAEAQLLLTISLLGYRADLLIRYICYELQHLQIIARCRNAVSHSTNAHLSAVIPLLCTRSSEHSKHLKHLKKRFGETLSQLSISKSKLQQYLEMNKSLARELLQADCIQLAKQKEAILQKESLLQRRVESLLSSSSSPSSSSPSPTSLFPLKTFGMGWCTNHSATAPTTPNREDEDGVIHNSSSSSSGSSDGSAGSVDYNQIMEDLERLESHIIQRKERRSFVKSKSSPFPHAVKFTDQGKSESQPRDCEEEKKKILKSDSVSSFHSQPNTVTNSKKRLNHFTDEEKAGSKEEEDDEDEGEEREGEEGEGVNFLATQLPAKKKRKQIIDHGENQLETSGEGTPEQQEDDASYTLQTQKD